MKYQVHQITNYEGMACDIITDPHKIYTDINDAYRRIAIVLGYWKDDPNAGWSFEIREVK